MFRAVAVAQAVVTAQCGPAGVAKPDIKACPDPITARQEWSWFCSMGVAVLWPGPCSGLEPSTQGPLQLDSTVVCL